MKKIIIISLVIIILSVLLFFGYRNDKTIASILSFQECSEHYPVMESYPRQCKTPDGRTFAEDIGNEMEKQDLIRIFSPRPNTIVKSPLDITGEARGYWFFEASFPVKIFDANNVLLGSGIAQAESDWMTENFVSFESNIEFQTSTTKTGTLILEKDNPSGLPQYEDKLTVPIIF